MIRRLTSLMLAGMTNIPKDGWPRMSGTLDVPAAGNDGADPPVASQLSISDRLDGLRAISSVRSTGEAPPLVQPSSTSAKAGPLNRPDGHAFDSSRMPPRAGHEVAADSTWPSPAHINPAMPDAGRLTVTDFALAGMKFDAGVWGPQDAIDELAAVHTEDRTKLFEMAAASAQRAADGAPVLQKHYKPSNEGLDTASPGAHGGSPNERSDAASPVGDDTIRLNATASGLSPESQVQTHLNSCLGYFAEARETFDLIYSNQYGGEGLSEHLETLKRHVDTAMMHGEECFRLLIAQTAADPQTDFSQTIRERQNAFQKYGKRYETGMADAQKSSSHVQDLIDVVSDMAENFKHLEQALGQ